MTPAWREPVGDPGLLGQQVEPRLADLAAPGGGCKARRGCRPAGLTVLHLDKDFEIIAGITGQPIERLEIT
jgi:hypothetical protein